MTKVLLPYEVIADRSILIRGRRVMLDRDLANMYGVKTRALNHAVKRNIKRFPEDFMFQMNEDELENLKSQFVTSSWGGTRKLVELERKIGRHDKDILMIFEAIKQLIKPEGEARKVIKGFSN